MKSIVLVTTLDNPNDKVLLVYKIFKTELEHPVVGTMNPTVISDKHDKLAVTRMTINY